MKCGLLGRKLGHSYSPAIHARLGNYDYSLFEKEPAELESFLRSSDFDGLNVTMPYKRAVIPFLDELTPEARELRAVNTVYRQGSRLIGHNTDLYGFRQMLRSSGLTPEGKKCLVLGSGGASSVVVQVLKSCGGAVTVISRSGENNYDNLFRHSDAAILVNTTPVGMYPETGLSPVDLEVFPQLEGVLDVIYNPVRTQLLMDARQRGIIAVNGLKMLVAQAKAAAECFTGAAISDDWIDKVYSLMQAETENIILIGMPGSGKSTVGRLVASEMGRCFVDIDTEIENRAQKTIPQIFAEDGECVFRVLETQALEKFGKQSGLVIATGGGCVTQPRNYSLLHQNGTIFWLQRDPERLPAHGRPLSQGRDLRQMYAQREPMYAAFADRCVDNHGRPADAVSHILAYWEDRK